MKIIAVIGNKDDSANFMNGLVEHRVNASEFNISGQNVTIQVESNVQKLLNTKQSAIIVTSNQIVDQTAQLPSDLVFFYNEHMDKSPYGLMRKLVNNNKIKPCQSKSFADSVFSLFGQTAKASNKSGAKMVGLNLGQEYGKFGKN